MDAQIPYDPCFPHGVLGVFISNGAKLGRDCVIFQQVTIGSNTLSDSVGAGAPTLGDRVYIGAGAKIIGNITIGDNCRIGANAVVYQDMPPNSVAVCAPTRIIQKECLDNRYIPPWIIKPTILKMDRCIRWIPYRAGTDRFRCRFSCSFVYSGIRRGDP